MPSRMMIRSCGSSIRTLINRHLRPTVAATIVQTETPGSIYNFHNLHPNSFAPQTVSFSRGFSNDAAGYSVLKEAASERRKENFDEASITEDEDEDRSWDDDDMDDFEYDSDYIAYEIESEE